MQSASPRLLLLATCLTLAPGLRAEPAPAAEAAKPAAVTAPSAAVPAVTNAVPLELPKFEVLGAGRIHAIEVELKKLDKMIAREKKNVRSSGLDKAFNNPELSKAATIFGGNSAAHLAAVAASRVSLLEAEREVLEAMKRPATLAARAEMEKELDQLRTTRRNLDDAAKQR